MDRRVRKTRTALQVSLMELLKSKDLDSITVKELCELADINKSTFYLHYRDIYDLIEKFELEAIDELSEILSANIDEVIKSGDFKELFKKICVFIKNYSPFTVALFMTRYDFNNLHELLREKCLLPLRQLIEENSDVPFEYFYSYSVAGIMAIISKWAENGMHESEEQIASYCAAMYIGKMGFEERH